MPVDDITIAKLTETVVRTNNIFTISEADEYYSRNAPHAANKISTLLEP